MKTPDSRLPGQAADPMEDSAPPPGTRPAAAPSGIIEPPLVSAFTHLIRNALTSVTFYIEALRQSLAGGEATEANEAFAGVERGVERALRVTARISEYTHASVATAPTQSAALARNLQSLAFRLGQELKPLGIALHIDVASDLKVRMNDHNLQLLAGHLLNNARDALRELTPGDGKKIDVRAEAANGQVVMTITDNGGGFSTEAKQRIFEPFFTTKGQSSTGLGLATCQKLLALHQGGIRIQSGPQGTTVSVTLPSGG